jgi:hydroxymethylpyrimidine/phosphomethylpyrimidine kinase
MATLPAGVAPPQALTIAASDSGGGAGIQADIKSIHANGVYALSVPVAITAQNTKTITMVHALPCEIISAQIDALFNDFTISAVKTGMLFSADIVGIVSAKLQAFEAKNIVVDPVMISKSGCELLQPDAILRMTQNLFPLAILVTPNIPEAELLAKMKITTQDDVKEAACRIHQSGCQNVLIKGGHFTLSPATDLLYDGNTFTTFHGEFINTPNTHGTGCTYSAAITAQLAKGKRLPDAVMIAKKYITEAIRHSLAIGHGNGSTHHFYFLQNEI